MPFYSTSLVFAALGENAAGVPLQQGLPAALFASTLRSPMMALLFGLLLGRVESTVVPSGYSIIVPPTTGLHHRRRGRH
jgi:hypothetical protein